MMRILKRQRMKLRQCLVCGSYAGSLRMTDLRGLKNNEVFNPFSIGHDRQRLISPGQYTDSIAGLGQPSPNERWVSGLVRQ